MPIKLGLSCAQSRWLPEWTGIETGTKIETETGIGSLVGSRWSLVGGRRLAIGSVSQKLVFVFQTGLPASVGVSVCQFVYLWIHKENP